MQLQQWQQQQQQEHVLVQLRGTQQLRWQAGAATDGAPANTCYMFSAQILKTPSLFRVCPGCCIWLQQATSTLLVAGGYLSSHMI
jgi:hypothetical protein